MLNFPKRVIKKGGSFSGFQVWNFYCSDTFSSLQSLQANPSVTKYQTRQARLITPLYDINSKFACLKV